MDKNILEKILEGSMEPTDLPLELLREITDGFSTDRIIGEGGFATVYEGIVGNRNVAVKRIKSSMTIDDKLFRREVDSLMKVQHQNVIRFLGYCSHTVETRMENAEYGGYIYVERRERLLCLEYISNGSLDQIISDELRGLEWDKRYEIIKGICTGLNYLHMEKCILHMDLKPANILLHNDMTPKITDFGLSRPTENSKTMRTTHFFTPGYCAPEDLVGCGRMSVQSDMYSLGVIIIELVTGHKGIPETNDNILRRWRHRWNKSGKEASLKYHDQVTKCIEIGSLCQKVDPYARPSISAIMSKFVELESMDYCRTIAHESTVGQTKPPYWEDDMLGVEPLELQFVNSGNDKQLILPCSVELSNNTDSFIAFKIQTTSPLLYSIEPNKHIVKPRSKCSVEIALRAANTRDHNNKKYTKEFIVRSIKVDEGLTTNDMNEDVFDKRITGHHVDEIYLSVIFEEPCNKEVTDSPSNQAKQYASSDGEQHVEWSNTIGTIGRELFNHCLVRLSRSDYGSVASLNHDFNSLVRNGDIYRLRWMNGVAEHWVYLSFNDGTEWVAYDPYRERWIQVPRMPPGVTFTGTELISVGTELFVVGARIIGCRYSILTNSWTRADGPNTPRAWLGSASDGEKAYVAGGTDDYTRKALRLAEMYDSETQTWIPLPSMNRARMACSAVLMDGKFYVIGGVNNQWVELRCGEEYDPKRRSWRVIENMADGLIGPKPLVAVVNNELYAATDSHHLMKHDKMDGTWITLGKLPEQYGSIHGDDIGFLACGERLIVIGGPRTCTAGMVELHSWIPDDQPPVWTLFATRSSQYKVYCSAVMSC